MIGEVIWAGAVTWKATWLIPILAHVLLNATAGEEVAWVSLIVSGIVLMDGVMLLIGNDMKERRMVDI